METLLRAIISELVEHPEEVQIVHRRSHRGHIFEVKVGEDDTARIIGKQGRVINALRTIAKAAGTREQEKVFLHLITPDGKFEERMPDERRGGRPGGPPRR
ncbi:MAG: KH domain-containing protein [bacterium]